MVFHWSGLLTLLKGRNYNKVVSLLSTTLSQVLSEADKHQSDRNRMKSRGEFLKGLGEKLKKMFSTRNCLEIPRSGGWCWSICRGNVPYYSWFDELLWHVRFLWLVNCEWLKFTFSEHNFKGIMLVNMIKHWMWFVKLICYLWMLFLEVVKESLFNKR